MRYALQAAEKALATDHIPVGAALYHTPKHAPSTLLWTGHNQTKKRFSVLQHAEMQAIQSGQRLLKSHFLTTCTLYVTLEPCAMCAAALSHARLGRLVFGAYNPKGGALIHGPQLYAKNRMCFKPEVIEGVLEKEASLLLKSYFQQKRAPCH